MADQTDPVPGAFSLARAPFFRGSPSATRFLWKSSRTFGESARFHLYGNGVTRIYLEARTRGLRQFHTL